MTSPYRAPGEHWIERALLRPLEFELPATGFGMDAAGIAALPDGGALVAFGDAGIVHLQRDGRILHRYDVPTDKLVVAMDGARALGVVSRGRRKQIYQYELDERRARPWLDIELNTWAPRHDGERWFVATHHGLLALDTRAAQARILWKLPLRGPPAEQAMNMHVDATQLRVLIGVDFSCWELWTFRLPQLLMLERTVLREFSEGFALDTYAFVFSTLGPNLVARWDQGERTLWANEQIYALPGRVLTGTDTWLVLVREQQLDGILELRHRHDHGVCVRVHTPGSMPIRADISGDRVWVLDNRGRAWSLSLVDGSLQHVPST